MPQHNDLSHSLLPLDQDSTLMAVIEMSQASWLVTATLLHGSNYLFSWCTFLSDLRAYSVVKRLTSGCLPQPFKAEHQILIVALCHA